MSRTSALDPIATYKIEELIESLKQYYTIVIVRIPCSRLPVFPQNRFFLLGIC
jgi:phosphate transport system ATP-binding protein